MSAPDPIPISLVAHHAFCPRRAWLEAAGEHTDTRQMAVGTRDHAASDDPTRSRTARVRALDVASDRLGIVGRCDTVEIGDDGAVTVVEHKATPLRRSTTVTAPMRVQLALQGAALADGGHRVAGYAVSFTTHRTRVEVDIEPDDVAMAEAEVVATRRVVESADAPPPLEDDPRCGSCSHVSICLPDERALGAVRRRITVADPDGETLHLATPGSHASVRAGRVLVKHRGEQLVSVPIDRVASVVAHGNVDLTGGLLRELMWRAVPIVWVTGTGRVVGFASSAGGPNGGPRHQQHVASAEGRLEIAREFVAAKIANQTTLLRRHANATELVPSLRTLQRRAARATSTGELFGIEGDAASRYFAAFADMLTPAVRARGITFDHRVRRPARDPVNCALNYVYGLLLGEVIRSIVAAGLDPHAGFLHSSNRNKPALALDLMEEFRAPVADAVVVAAFNNGELAAHDFSSVLQTTRLRDSGRRALIAAHERRMATHIVHPIFGYRVTWRRVLEVQARMILGVIDGTQPAYCGIRIR